MAFVQAVEEWSLEDHIGFSDLVSGCSHPCRD